MIALSAAGSSGSSSGSPGGCSRGIGRAGRLARRVFPRPRPLPSSSSSRAPAAAPPCPLGRTFPRQRTCWGQPVSPGPPTWRRSPSATRLIASSWREHGLGAVLALVGVVPGIRLDPVAQRAARRVPQLGGEVIHGHLAGHREPQIQRILLGPLVVHSNSLPDTWVSNESAPEGANDSELKACKSAPFADQAFLDSFWNAGLHRRDWTLIGRDLVHFRGAPGD